MSDVVKTLFNAVVLALSVSSVAIVAFGNGTAIGAAILIVVCSCVACSVYPKIKMNSCGCTGDTGFIAAVGPPPSQECLTCIKPLQTAYYAFCIFLSTVFVAIFIYAITIRRSS